MTTPWIVALAATWALLIALVFVCVGWLRRVGVVLEKAEQHLIAQGSGVNALTRLPVFSLRDAAGASHSSEDLIREPTLILFMESTCQPCRKLAVELGRFDDTVDGVPLLVVVDDTEADHALQLPPRLRVLYERDHEVSDLFQSYTTPQAFAVDVGGVVLDRTRPRNATDLRHMAWWQREGGAEPTTSESEAAGAAAVA